jgi:RNA ligase partner protein
MNAVIDTTVLLNPSVYKIFNEDKQIAAEAILTKLSSKYKILIAPSVRDEIGIILELSKLDKYWIIKSPDYTKSIPALAIKEYINSIRTRLDKALRISEEAVRSQNSDEESIRDLRQKFRTYVRTGILDSVADLDSVMLAYQENAILITSDIGMIKFAEVLGVSYMIAEHIVND